MMLTLGAMGLKKQSQGYCLFSFAWKFLHSYCFLSAFLSLAVATGIAPTCFRAHLVEKSAAWHLPDSWETRLVCCSAEARLQILGLALATFLSVFSESRHWFPSLILTIIWICNRKPLLSQGLCSKWFSGSWICSFIWFSQLLWELGSTRILNPRTQKGKGKWLMSQRGDVTGPVNTRADAPGKKEHRDAVPSLPQHLFCKN